MMTRLKIGDRAPDFEGTTENGEKLGLTDLRGKKVILYFYPKDNTPGCTTQACGFRDNYQDIESAGAVVLGISPDGESSHLKFQQKYDLPFRLLVDSDNSIAGAYGAWGEKSMYGRKYMGIIRSHFVLDEEGRVLDVQYKVSPKKSVELALKAVAG